MENSEKMIITFGKYKGMRLGSVPGPYLCWAIRKQAFKQEAMIAAQERLKKLVKSREADLSSFSYEELCSLEHQGGPLLNTLRKELRRRRRKT
jgi:uncharacterized protein (DUF3820 family)